MYLILVGAATVGASLAELAAQDGHNVVVLERDKQLATELSQKLDVSVLNAHIGEQDIMEEAGLNKADAMIATTTDDASNLMAMFLAAEAGVKVLISVVNAPGHEPLFKRLGVHVLLDPEVVVARHLYGLLTQPRVEEMALLEEDEEIFGITLTSKSTLIDHTLAEVREKHLLPKGFEIVAVKRGGERFLAENDASLQAGDHLTVYSLKRVTPHQLKPFLGDEGG